MTCKFVAIRHSFCEKSRSKKTFNLLHHKNLAIGFDIKLDAIGVQRDSVFIPRYGWKWIPGYGTLCVVNKIISLKYGLRAIEIKINEKAEDTNEKS